MMHADCALIINFIWIQNIRFITNALSLRYVFAYMFLFFALGAIILRKVDYEQGMIDAGKIKDTKDVRSDFVASVEMTEDLNQINPAASSSIGV